MTQKSILFLTGTRADFGKIKPLIKALKATSSISTSIFTTGMHMLKRYGSTWEEVTKSNLGEVHPFINQSPGDTMDQILSKTISGLSDYVQEARPDLIVVHGDRVEALAGAIVGSLNNIKVGHIEGGELSGTIDELLRHAITKLSHLHFVSNEDAARRLIQMGEAESTVHVIGSPDIDAMNSPHLPSLQESLDHYQLKFQDYGILIFHPVTTEVDQIAQQTRTTLNAVVEHGTPTIVIESNNDSGSELIQEIYDEFRSEPLLRFFPSMRFEFFLTLLKNARFIIGNSSAGVREAPHYGVPAVNLGTRQRNRVTSPLVLDAEISLAAIKEKLTLTEVIPRVPESNFGDGRSAERFMSLIKSERFWQTPVQKQFIDMERL